MMQNLENEAYFNDSLTSSPVQSLTISQKSIGIPRYFFHIFLDFGNKNKR
jgi:polysaccharide deacetylase 2 family uncharacterized protein YibQ